jgi:hypothetical protein
MQHLLFKKPTQHQQRTWDTLVKYIKSRLRSGERDRFLYGDLSEDIFGARNKGGQSFGGSLGQIHDRTSQYNKKFKTEHPLLNALVFNQKGEQPGIPKSQEPDEIWSILEQSGPQYLDRLAVLLGYADFSGHRLGFKNKHSGQSQDAEGAQSGGERSAVTWSAKHSPWVKEIGDALDELGWKVKIDGRPWEPDLLRASPDGDKRTLIEVKPECGTHNAITAIGQVICYSSGMKNVLKVIAVPGSKSLPLHITNVLKSNDIKILDLDESDLLPPLKVICAAEPE